MEAQASGLPVVSTRHSGIPELVADGRSGFLVEERDVEALAEALKTLIERPALRRAFGDSGRRIVETRYNVRRLNERLVELYTALVRGSRVVSLEDTSDAQGWPDNGNIPASAPDVSIVIPTRNRAKSLRQTLESLASQQTDGRFTYEILVVDNGSTDATRQLVQGMAAGYPVPLTCLVEPRVGKPFAVNTGIAHTHSALLVFTDDDVAAEPAWLLGLWRCFHETDTEAVAGRVLPLWLDGRPEWMTDQVMGRLGTLGCLNFGTERLVISQATRHYWWVGGNIGVRRSVVERFGGFDIRRARGQDTELFERYDAAGVKIVYEPQALIHHKIGRNRLTSNAFRAWYDRQGFYRAYELAWRPHHLVTIMSLYCYQEWWSCIKRWWLAPRSPEAFWERLSYECKARAWLHVFLHRLRLWPRWLLTGLTGRSYMPEAKI